MLDGHFELAMTICPTVCFAISFSDFYWPKDPLDISIVLFIAHIHLKYLKQNGVTQTVLMVFLSVPPE